MNVNWTLTHAIKLRGRRVTPGVELSLRGERGRFRFERHVANSATGTEWLDLRGPNGEWRSVREERVRTVHRVAKARPARRTLAVAA